EHLVEEYRPQEKTLSITKYVNGKVVATYHFKADGPIHNAVILPFSLRNVKDLKTGWTFTARLPDPIKIELVAIENIEVPAGAFKAYHFTSDPKKVEIWISCDEARIPVKIKGFGGYDYTLVMEKVEKGSLVR
ncbi:MAG: hypothetical protein PHS61_08255, partial [Candidatus Omnitrophica bacterium]|nr:hypothetical protein [Candidatus Omnitrophota bacterium]